MGGPTHLFDAINTAGEWRNFIKQPTAMAATTALREALNQGISSGNLVDTKIILYSRRNSSGQVWQPRPLYANSRVLKTTPYFNDREYAATLGVVLVGPHTFIFEVLFGNFAEAQSKDFKKEIDGDETTEDYGYLSDSDLEDDEDERSTSSNEKIRPMLHPFDPFVTPREEKGPLSEEDEERIEEGKVVKIPDVAFVTWVQLKTSLTFR